MLMSLRKAFSLSRLFLICPWEGAAGPENLRVFMTPRSSAHKASWMIIWWEGGTVSRDERASALPPCPTPTHLQPGVWEAQGQVQIASGLPAPDTELGGASTAPSGLTNFQ